MATNQSNIDILIKRRLDRQGASADAPGTNALKSGELAMNEVDKTVYYGLSTVSGISAIPIAGAGFLSKTTANVTGTVTGNIEGGTATTQSLTSDILLGGYNAGEEIPAGTTLAQFITGLLYREYNPDLSNGPSSSFTATVPGGVVEVGATVDVTLNTTFNQGQILGSTSGTWDASTVQGAQAGAATGYKLNKGTGEYVDDSDGDDTVSIAFGSAAVTFGSKVSYAQGQQPLTSKGNPYSTPLAAATDALEKTATVTPQRKYFYKVSSTPIASVNSSDIRSMTGSFNKPASLPFGIGDLYAVLALPPGHSLTAAIGDGGFSVLGNYQSKTVSVDGATPGQDSTNYTVYTFQTNEQPKAISHVYTIS